MTDREKIIKIAQPYISAWGDDERLADALIENDIGDISEWKEKCEKEKSKLERYKRALSCACKVSAAIPTKELVKARVDCFLRQAEKEIEEERK